MYWSAHVVIHLTPIYVTKVLLIKGQFARTENHPIDRYWNALTSTFFEISHLIVKIWRAPLFSERQQ